MGLITNLNQMFKASENLFQKESIEALQQKLQAPLAELTRYLESQVDTFEDQIQFLVKYCLKNNGKRLRPSLVFLTGKAEDSEVFDKLIRVSAVVEMVHIATLVHDDILDNADKRHDKPTIASKYGDHTAVLLGDALFSHALHLAAQFDTVEVCRLVSQSTRRVCSGEIIQTFRRGDWKLSLKEYLETLDMKTGELFSVSTYLGALLSGYDQRHCETLREFGSRLGIAYQAYDDLTDFLGEESKIGKTLGTDLETGKATLPLIQLFQKKNAQLKESMIVALDDRNEARVREILEENAIFEEGITFVHQLLDEAITLLEELPPHLPAKTNLGSMGAILRSKLQELQDKRASA